MLIAQKKFTTENLPLTENTIFSISVVRNQVFFATLDPSLQFSLYYIAASSLAFVAKPSMLRPVQYCPLCISRPIASVFFRLLSCLFVCLFAAIIRHPAPLTFVRSSLTAPAPSSLSTFAVVWQNRLFQ